MGVALYPGSFDPVHNGHIAVIEMAAAVFDEVVVGVGHNPAKPSGFFTGPERMALIEAEVASLANVRVTGFSGLVTVAADELGATCLVKGLRSSTDLDAEMLQANMNATTGGGLPTVFLPGLGEHALVSSRYVREIASAGGDVSSVVPASVMDALAERGAQ
ncbi:MAG: pantetheine-phosphate adenylyltransferase [Actinomycetota bacterium]